MQRSTLMIIFFPPTNYEVVEPNVLCLYYKFISEQIFLSEFSKSLKNSLSFSFFFLKGISRERDRANIKITKWRRNEENFQKSIWNSHDNRAPPWQLCRVLGKRDIFTESTIIIQLRVTSTMSGNSIDAEDIFVANFFDVESTSPVNDVSNRLTVP